MKFALGTVSSQMHTTYASHISHTRCLRTI